MATNWIQPALTSNTSHGTVTCGNYNASSSNLATNVLPFYAFDNNSATWWETDGNTTASWIQWTLPSPILIKGLQVQVRPGDRPNLIARAYSSSSKTIPIGNSISTTTASQNETVSGIPSVGIETDTLYIDCTSTQNYLGVGNVIITANNLNIYDNTNTLFKYTNMTHVCTSDAYSYQYGNRRTAVAGSDGSVDFWLSGATYFSLHGQTHTDGRNQSIQYYLNETLKETFSAPQTTSSGRVRWGVVSNSLDENTTNHIRLQLGSTGYFSFDEIHTDGILVQNPGAASTLTFTSSEKILSINLDQLHSGLQRLKTLVTSVDNCGNCPGNMLCQISSCESTSCQNCQTCQGCQSCQSTTCQSQSCQKCQTCQTCQKCQK